MSADPVAWLREQTADDRRLTEEAAREFPPPWKVDMAWPAVLYDATGAMITEAEDTGTGILLGDAAPVHIARWDPARVLAECDAKLAIIDLHQSTSRVTNKVLCADCDQDWPCPTLLAVASVHEFRARLPRRMETSMTDQVNVEFSPGGPSEGMPLTCQSCGSLVLDNQRSKWLHKEWHQAVAPTPEPSGATGE